MNKVPNMISTKDLIYLSDTFEGNLTALKKANAYSSLVTDKKLQKELESVCKKHEKICQDLLKLLEGGSEA